VLNVVGTRATSWRRTSRSPQGATRQGRGRRHRGRPRLARRSEPRCWSSGGRFEHGRSGDPEHHRRRRGSGPRRPREDRAGFNFAHPRCHRKGPGRANAGLGEPSTSNRGRPSSGVLGVRRWPRCGRDGLLPSPAADRAPSSNPVSPTGTSNGRRGFTRLTPRRSDPSASPGPWQLARRPSARSAARRQSRRPAR
jgi:hypothetical protein